MHAMSLFESRRDELEKRLGWPDRLGQRLENRGYLLSGSRMN